jgi:hypothetical protein
VGLPDVRCAASELVAEEHPATSTQVSATAGAKVRQGMAHSVSDRGVIRGATSKADSVLAGKSLIAPAAMR